MAITIKDDMVEKTWAERTNAVIEDVDVKTLKKIAAQQKTDNTDISTAVMQQMKDTGKDCVVRASTMFGEATFIGTTEKVFSVAGKEHKVAYHIQAKLPVAKPSKKKLADFRDELLG